MTGSSILLLGIVMLAMLPAFNDRCREEPGFRERVVRDEVVHFFIAFRVDDQDASSHVVVARSRSGAKRRAAELNLLFVRTQVGKVGCIVIQPNLEIARDVFTVDEK